MRTWTILLLLSCITASAQDTLSVRLMDRDLVLTDPVQGVRHLRKTVKLPPASTPVRRILLTLTYACPDSLHCGEWDYLDQVFVKPLHGQDSVEMARLLTPYGGLFRPDWRFAWVSDVSDLWPVLRDSVELIHVHHGFEPDNDRGWAVSLDLQYITGQAIAPVLGIGQLYRGSFAYGDSSKPIEKQLAPRNLPSLPGAEWLRIRAQQTGHGMNPSDGCGEFCSKWRSISVDGQPVQHRALWKECASNPLSPQAGTWIFDRALWCPGELQPPDLITVPLDPGRYEHVVDLDMEPYATDSSTAMTDLSAYAVQLGKATARNDALITEVLVPSDQPRHARMNETHDGPRIVIANAGSDTLRSLSIRYGSIGGTQRRFAWTGLLAFGASDTVDLPGPVDHGAGRNRFLATLEKPNGKRDAWPADNSLRSSCNPVDVIPGTVVLQLRTNKQPEQNALRLTDADGHVILERGQGSLRADTLYSDTLRLPPHSYRLQLTDTAGDGLEFWYNTEGGQGYMRLLDAQGRLLKRFESDCGNGVTWLFRTGGAATLAPDTAPSISLFPRRITHSTVLDYFANEAAMLRVEVTADDSSLVQEFRPNTPVKEARFTLDLTGNKPGRYAVCVRRNGQEVFRQRIRLEP
jgi:hypothetical protein